MRHHHVMIRTLLANTAKSSYDDNNTQRVKIGFAERAEIPRTGSREAVRFLE